MPDIAENNNPVPSGGAPEQQAANISVWSQNTSDEIRRDLWVLKNEDSTFVGAMEIDGSTDISGNVTITGDLEVSGSVPIGPDISISGALYVDDTADFSSIGVDGTATLADVSISGWLGVDGSCDFSDVGLEGDFIPTKCITDNGGFLDEDTLASDSTAAVASQQSVKAYVDAQSPTVFTDRGDPAGPDFDDATGFTTIGAYNNLDLSGIVASGAKAVLIRIIGRDNLVQTTVRIRENGNSNQQNIGRMDTNVANIEINADMVIPLSSDRIIQYNQDVDWDFIQLVVKGWWI